MGCSGESAARVHTVGSGGEEAGILGGDLGQQEKLEDPDLEGSFDNLYIPAQTEGQSGPNTFRRELWPRGVTFPSQPQADLNLTPGQSTPGDPLL